VIAPAGAVGALPVLRDQTLEAKLAGLAERVEGHSARGRSRFERDIFRSAALSASCCNSVSSIVQISGARLCAFLNPDSLELGHFDNPQLGPASHGLGGDDDVCPFISQ
jgi:hypothetical protein